MSTSPRNEVSVLNIENQATHLGQELNANSLEHSRDQEAVERMHESQSEAHEAHEEGANTSSTESNPNGEHAQGANQEQAQSNQNGQKKSGINKSVLRRLEKNKNEEDPEAMRVWAEAAQVQFGNNGENPYVVSNMPLEIQLAFVRKLFGLLGLQLNSTVVVAIIVTIILNKILPESFHKLTAPSGKIDEDSGEKSISLSSYGFASVLATLFLLLMLSRYRKKFPANLICLGFFTISQGTTIAILDTSIRSKLFLHAFAVCILTFVVVALMALLVKPGTKAMEVLEWFDEKWEKCRSPRVADEEWESEYGRYGSEYEGRRGSDYEGRRGTEYGRRETEYGRRGTEYGRRETEYGRRRSGNQEREATIEEGDLAPNEQMTQMLVRLKLRTITAFCIVSLFSIILHHALPGSRVPLVEGGNPMYRDYLGMTGPGITLSLIFAGALAIWAAYDVLSLTEKLTADEYMQGVIFFYSDLLVILSLMMVLILTMAACGDDGGGNANGGEEAVGAVQR